jgi:glycine hydroxymethyltransferase
MTTRGFDEADARKVGELIARAIFERDDAGALAVVRREVDALIDEHPLYPEL